MIFEKDASKVDLFFPNIFKMGKVGNIDFCLPTITPTIVSNTISDDEPVCMLLVSKSAKCKKG